MPRELVIGGDQPFVRCLLGISISPRVGSIYNMGVWDKGAIVARLLRTGGHWLERRTPVAAIKDGPQLGEWGMHSGAPGPNG